METKDKRIMTLYESKLSAVQYAMKGAGILALVGLIDVIAIGFIQDSRATVAESPHMKPAFFQAVAAALHVPAAQEVSRQRVEAESDQQQHGWKAPGGLCRDC